jgi:hypothetical protein
MEYGSQTLTHTDELTSRVWENGGGITNNLSNKRSRTDSDTIPKIWARLTQTLQNRLKR